MSKKILIFAFVVTLFSITIIFSWWNSAKTLFERVEAGVFIEGVNVEKCSKSELELIIKELAKANEYDPINAVYNEKYNIITPEICGVKIDQEKTIQNALNAKQGAVIKLVKTYIEPDITMSSYPKAIIRQGNEAKPKMTILINVDWGVPEPVDDFLQVLKSYDVKTTFCVTGRITDKFPEKIAEIVLEGHEIASHGYYHHGSRYNYHKMTTDQFIEDFSKAQTAIDNSSSTEVKYYSPPSGIVNDNLLAATHKLNYRTVLWTEGLDTVDWREPASATIVKKITSKAKNGGIVLMHPKMCSLEALPQILEYLKNNNITVVPLRDLLSPYK